MKKVKLYEISKEPRRFLRTRCTNIPNILDINLLEDISKRAIATMLHANGCGLAAPQIGSSLRFVVVKLGEEIIFAINPRITSFSVAQFVSPEGCLSIPGVVGVVHRSTKICVEYTTLNDDICVRNFSNHYAAIWQHEIDHLNGILFTDIALAVWRESIKTL